MLTSIPPPLADGLTGVRLFTPCDDESCDVYENPSRLRITSARWYPSTTRLTDGSLFIAGGMVAGGYNNAESTDNPTFEHYPAKGDGMQIYSKFLHDALNSNLFPVVFTLPSGYVFIAANKMAMLYDTVTNTERRLKKCVGCFSRSLVPRTDSLLCAASRTALPSRTLPRQVALFFLSQSPTTVRSILFVCIDRVDAFFYAGTPEVVFFGGTTADLDADPSTVRLRPLSRLDCGLTLSLPQMSATSPASKQVVRMKLNAAGIKKGWEVDTMPYARTMSDCIQLPDSKILLINGAAQGIAGYALFPLAFFGVTDFPYSPTATVTSRTRCATLAVLLPS